VRNMWGVQIDGMCFGVLNLNNLLYNYFRLKIK